MTTIDITTRPLQGAFGVEVTGVDVAAGGEALHRELASLFERHGVLLIREQALSPEEQLRFTRAFGEPETNQRLEFTLPSLPEVYVLSNKEKDGRRIGDVDAGQAWHTDASYLERPALCTILHAIEVPDEGSDTLLADLCGAWAALPEETRAELDGLGVIHSWRTLMALKGIVLEDDGGYPDVVHPLARRHPVDGRVALWVTTGTTRGIVGRPEAAGVELIQRLVDHATQPRFVFRHRWQPGDILIWDNRVTLHTGTPFDTTRYDRLVHRTWTRGERPQ